MYSDYENGIAAIGIMQAIFGLIIVGLVLFGLWKVFEKAGEPGWKAIVPLYNTYTAFKIAMGCGWIFLLALIPFVRVIVLIIFGWKLAKSFGRGVGFAVGLFFLPMVFLLILGFDDSKYIGPNGEAAGQSAAPTSQPVQTVTFTTESNPETNNNNVWEQPGKDE